MTAPGGLPRGHERSWALIFTTGQWRPPASHRRATTCLESVLAENDHDDTVEPYGRYSA